MARKAVMMVLTNRSHTLRTTLGHSIHFEKDVPTLVAPSIINQALAIGAAPVDGSNPIPPVEVPDIDPVDPSERAMLIRTAVEAMYTDNQRGDFTASNSPRLKAVSTRAGFKVDMRELRAVMNKINQEKEDANKG